MVNQRYDLQNDPRARQDMLASEYPSGVITGPMDNCAVSRLPFAETVLPSGPSQPYP